MPTLISTLPPVLKVSLFSTEFKMGSIFSTSCTNRGSPNLSEVSRVFKKDSSLNEVLASFFAVREDIMKLCAYPEGSMINGYLWNLFKIMAFSIHKSSEGKVCDYQVSLSDGLLRNSMIDKSSLYRMFTFTRYSLQVLSTTFL